MTTKQNTQNNKKEGSITGIERSSANQHVKLLLRDIKEKLGEVILVAINSRTTIELSAHLSQSERDARVENYIRLHKSNI